MGGTSPKKNKAVPAKGLLLGGCGCAVLSVVLIGIIIVIAVIVMSMNRQQVPRQPMPEPQPVPQQPTTPQLPVAPQPQTQTQPQPQPQPQQGGYQPLKQNEFEITFAKDLSRDGMPVNITRKFSVNDQQIIMMLRWGPNTVPAGAYVTANWYYYNKTLVRTSSFTTQEGLMGVFDKVDRPSNGFPTGEFNVYIAINNTPVIDHSFSIQ